MKHQYSRSLGPRFDDPTVCWPWHKRPKQTKWFEHKVPVGVYGYEDDFKTPIIFHEWCKRYDLDFKDWVHGPPVTRGNDFKNLWTFKLVNTCGNLICVNPHHFRCEKVPITSGNHRYPLPPPYGEQFFNSP